MEDIEKRLTALEKQDLRIAKMMGASFVPMVRNMVARTLTGETQASFIKHFEKEREVVRKRLEDAQTIESVFGIMTKFDEEISDYIRATKVDTADKAMEIAHSFIKKYSPVALPLKAVKEDDVWLVDIDVGALAVKIAKVKVDARTGDILSYEIPTRDSKGS